MLGKIEFPEPKTHNWAGMSVKTFIRIFSLTLFPLEESHAKGFDIFHPIPRGFSKSRDSHLETYLFGNFLPVIPRIAEVQLRNLSVFIVEMQIVLFGKTNSSMKLLRDLG